MRVFTMALRPLDNKLMEKEIRKKVKEELYKRDPGLAVHLELQETTDKLEQIVEELKQPANVTVTINIT